MLLLWVVSLHFCVHEISYKFNRFKPFNPLVTFSGCSGIYVDSAFFGFRIVLLLVPGFGDLRFETVMNNCTPAAGFNFICC